MSGGTNVREFYTCPERQQADLQGVGSIGNASPKHFLLLDQSPNSLAQRRTLKVRNCIIDDLLIAGCLDDSKLTHQSSGFDEAGTFL